MYFKGKEYLPMKSTIDRILRILLLVTLGLFVATLILSILDMQGYPVNGDIPLLTLISNKLIDLVKIVAFWWAVAAISGDKKSAQVGAAIILCHWVWHGFQLLIGVIYFDYWLGYFVLIVAYGAFGLLHFKKSFGLIMLLAAFLTKGIMLGFNSWSYNDWFKDIYNLAGVANPFVIEISWGDGRYTSVEVLTILWDQRYMLLSFFIFWFTYRLACHPNRIDLSMRTCEVMEKQDKLTFSIIYFTLGMTLTIAVFELGYLLKNGDSAMSMIQGVWQLLWCLLALYVIASLYRNYLTQWMVKEGSYPGWLYFLLNVPLVGIFTWLFILLRTKKQFETVGATTDVSSLQGKFEIEGNRSILLTILALIVLNFVIERIGFSTWLSSASGGDTWLLLIMITVAIVTFLWYSASEKAAFFILAFSAFILTVQLIRGQNWLDPMLVVAGIVNLVVYYPLFHFHKLKFDTSKLS